MNIKHILIAIVAVAVVSKSCSMSEESTDSDSHLSGEKEAGTIEVKKLSEERCGDTSTIYGYDSYGNLTSIEHDDGDINGKMITKYEYDYSHNNRLVKESRGNKRYKSEQTYEYDESGVLIKDISTWHERSSKSTTTTYYTYDSSGQLVEKESYTENRNGKRNYVSIEYEYDSFGNVIAEISDKKKIVYEYDDSGNLLREACYNSEGKELSYEYIYEYENGKLVKETSSSFGTITYYVYEEGKVTENIYDENENLFIRITEYDDDGDIVHIREENESGKVTNYYYYYQNILVKPS